MRRVSAWPLRSTQRGRCGAFPKRKTLTGQLFAVGKGRKDGEVGLVAEGKVHRGRVAQRFGLADVVAHRVLQLQRELLARWKERQGR